MSSIESNSWQDQFFQEDFNVDKCLTKLTQKYGLDILKSNLKNYGEELHRQMAEILKTETEAIVNLAEYLTNLNTKIEDLSVSLLQLKEELQVLHMLIKNARLEYKTVLDSKRINETEKKNLLARLDFILNVLYVENIIRLIEKEDGPKLVNLRRAVSKYSFQNTYLTELGITGKNNVIMSTENKLLSMVHQYFLLGFKNRDVDCITMCLQMYNNLDKQREAEEYYELNIVRPFLQHLYIEKSVYKFDQNVDEIYAQTLNFMYSEMKIINEALTKNLDLKSSFNFILNSFWPEVDRQCRKGLSHITAPGNPELFQKRFVSTWNFLSKIAEECGNPNLMKTHPSFQDHIKRFNLPVYFEIRFQQIASQFETDLCVKPNDHSIFSENNSQFKLKTTSSLFIALNKCFSDTVFICQLADQFLKLSMFLLSRYLRWFEEFLRQTSNKDLLERFLMDSLIDLKKLIGILGDKNNMESNENIYAIFPKRMSPIITKVFDSNLQILDKFSGKLNNHVVTMKVGECSEHLQNITAIPRLFRRTNRSPPKEPSTYMIEAMKPISMFSEKYKEIQGDVLSPLLRNTVLSVSKQYSTLVHDVLQSVCKTEESLRRLKSRNISSHEDSTTSPETMSDEMKIREQIKLDINHFILMLEPITPADMKKTLDDLKKLC